MLKRLALVLFLAWEAYWAYEFAMAPRPDEEMRTVAALFCGLIVPLFVGLLVGFCYAVRDFLPPRN